MAEKFAPRVYKKANPGDDGRVWFLLSWFFALGHSVRAWARAFPCPANDQTGGWVHE